MRTPDLDFSTQLLLMTVLTVLSTAIVLRGFVFIQRKLAQVPHRYPSSWTPRQCHFAEQFRSVVGLLLGLLWVVLLFAAPLMPTGWPFGLIEILSVVVLLLLSHAWILLILPSDWEALGVLTRRFEGAMAILVLWWVLALSGTVWMLTKAVGLDIALLVQRNAGWA